MQLNFYNETESDINDLLPDVKKALETSLKIEGRKEDFEISFTLVDNATIMKLNKEFRGVDSVTDVLSFPIWDGELSNDNLLGDIVISVDKVREQAEEYGHSFERELIYLSVHSLLHLLGYDHMEEDERILMRQHEKIIMKELEIFK